MTVPPSGTVRPVSSLRRRHHTVAFGNFVVLGFHVGVWAVQLAGLATALRLDPGRLGGAVTAAAAAGVVTLFAGGYLADRLGRRPVLLLGYGGTALSFVWLSRVHSMGSLIAAVVAYGLFISFVDLGANSVGSDYEHLHGVRAMNGLHAGFSLGGLLGALGSAFVLWSGADFRAVYLGLALVLAVAAAAATVAPLPVRARAAAAHRNPPPQQPVWRIPAVCFAIALIAVTFFGDGALESFLAVYFRGTLGSSVLLTGAGLAAYHLASLTGRLLATRVLRRWKERATVLGAGVFAAGGIALAVLAPSAGLAISGLLLVGLAIAPVVPSALSLAGRAAPGRAAQAVAVSTASGYGVYVFSPLAVGELAQATNLRVGLALLIATSLVIAVLGSRWPAATDEPSRPTGQGAGTTAPTDAVAGRS